MSSADSEALRFYSYNGYKCTSLLGELETTYIFKVTGGSNWKRAWRGGGVLWREEWNKSQVKQDRMRRRQVERCRGSE